MTQQQLGSAVSSVDWIDWAKNSVSITQNFYTGAENKAPLHQTSKILSLLSAAVQNATGCCVQKHRTYIDPRQQRHDNAPHPRQQPVEKQARGDAPDAHCHREEDSHRKVREGSPLRHDDGRCGESFFLRDRKPQATTRHDNEGTSKERRNEGTKEQTKERKNERTNERTNAASRVFEVFEVFFN